MRYQRLPLAVIQHSRPACSKRNSLERLLALALGVKMVVCLGPLLVLASVIVIACYSAATNDVLNAVLPDASFTGRTDVAVRDRSRHGASAHRFRVHGVLADT
jgi:hypothetical protein